MPLVYLNVCISVKTYAHICVDNIYIYIYIIYIYIYIIYIISYVLGLLGGFYWIFWNHQGQTNKHRYLNGRLDVVNVLLS